MASIDPEKFAQPIYVRLPVEIAEEIRSQDRWQTRRLETYSLDVSWRTIFGGTGA